MFGAEEVEKEKNVLEKRKLHRHRKKIRETGCKEVKVGIEKRFEEERCRIRRSEEEIRREG